MSSGKPFKRILAILLMLGGISGYSHCQKIDSTSFRANARFSFYSVERKGEILLHIPDILIHNNILINLVSGSVTIGQWQGVPGKRILRIPVSLDEITGEKKIRIEIKSLSKSYLAYSSLTKLAHKPNEVKTDRLTGGLIVNGIQFFPFGFYTYSPVYSTLPEEEVVKGFNMISPYQKISPETISERKAYMDRCAQLGMKVHYNLLSVSGGGGVASAIDGLTDARKKELLLNEIRTFRDHPALLAWYIADEPNGNKISPDSLKKIYELVKKNDPWHPVSIVFMAPFMSSRSYADALDIVMADPYPVPVSPITITGKVAGQLSKEFAGRKPVWIVPQAFGGGEWWEREPSLQELRSMTYQSIVNGAGGIQYFVRQGLNLFPKSTSTWNECGRMAAEIAELTPWLLSEEDPVGVRSGTRDISTSSYVHDNQLIIIAVNEANVPVKADFSLEKPFTGKLRVLFENRYINLRNGYFTDYLPAYGSQVWLFNLKDPEKTLKPWSENLIRDPGFEDITSPGVPSACYARGSSDRGATYFLDSRVHLEGTHSLRLVTPAENKSVRLRFFPFAGRNGGSYYISIFARGEPDPSGNVSRYFEISLGDMVKSRFQLTSEWKVYTAILTIPYYNDQSPRTNVILQMPSAGIAWFDMFQVAESEEITRSVNPELSIDEF